MSVYILEGARTPIGTFLGALANVPAPKLGAVAISEILKRANGSQKISYEKSGGKSQGKNQDKIDQVIMGNVIQAGVGQAPARQASLFAGISEEVPCTTVNKVCGSGMEALILGANSIKAGEANLIVAGGMENMSLAPHLLPSLRTGNKFGESKILDAMVWDGLRDVYTDRAMGNCAEECVKKYSLSREEQDAYAIASFKKAQAAIKDGLFEDEIAPVTIREKKSDIIVNEDEGPLKANFEKIPTLRPAFDSEGTITAANASSINDGAAALLIGGERYKNSANFRIVAYANNAHAPTWFTTAPVEAMRKCAAKANISLRDIDLFEINEAFAAVAMVAIRECQLDESKVNIFGGAVSLGHPIGCSGARIVVTLMNAMRRKQARLGMASICIGGGEALAMILERIK